MSFPAPPRPGVPPRWSILIPARNEEHHLSACLAAICSLTYDRSAFEVLVIDNGSTDRTVAVARSFCDRLALTVYEREGGTVGALRNFGAQQASGERLAFLDADCLPPPAWLAAADRVLSEAPEGIAGSPYALPADAGWPARVWHRRFQAQKSGIVGYVPAGGLLISRALFTLLGGFDASLRSNEDSQLCTRARRAGYPTRSVPELAVVHLGAERNLRHFVRRQRWHGAAVLNRSGLRGNVRAIALAAATLALLLGAAVALASSYPWAALLLLAGTMLLPAGMCRPPISLPDLVTYTLPLWVLIWIYALVRAAVLPLAAVRGLQGLRGTPIVPWSSALGERDAAPRH